MADEVNENIFLVNAPAGSGKTTWIRQQVESYLLRIPRIIFYVLLIQIALQKNWEEIWSRAEYILEQYISFIN